MGAWGTKVQTTTLSALEGNIINSLDPVVGVDPTKNAPSISVVNTALGTLDTAVDTINDNLSGFKFYPTGTELIALQSDDSYYTDNDGKYIIADSPTGQQMLEDYPSTYKALASTEDTRGEVGADSASPFSTNKELVGEVLYKGGGSNSHGYAFSFTVNFTKDYKIVALYTVCNSSWDNGTITLSRGTYNQLFKGNQSSRVMNIGYINDVKSGDSLSFSEGGYEGYGTVIGFLES